MNFFEKQRLLIYSCVFKLLQTYMLMPLDLLSRQQGLRQTLQTISYAHKKGAKHKFVLVRGIHIQLMILVRNLHASKKKDFKIMMIHHWRRRLMSKNIFTLGCRDKKMNLSKDHIKTKNLWNTWKKRQSTSSDAFSNHLS